MKAAAFCLGIMSGRHPCIWCTWDCRTGLSKVDWHLRSSAHHALMFGKLCDEYNGDSKRHAVDCDGVENPEKDAFIQSGNSCSTKINVVCRHLIPFINEYLPKGMGLGAVFRTGN